MADQGFFGNLTNSMQSPLFLGGAGILMGGGFQGMNQGIQAGILGEKNKFDQQQAIQDRLRQQQQDAENLRRWNTTDARAADMHPVEMQLKQAHTDKFLADAEQARSDAKNGGKVSLTPIYGTDAQGNPVVMQPNQRGEMQRSVMPEGVTVSRQPIKMDAGTHFVLIDPVTRQPIATVQKDVAGAESAKVQGKSQGQAVADMPTVIAKAEDAIATSQKLRNHPGLYWGTGGTGIIPGIPGTEQKDFVALHDQAKGQAFLQAFQMLKGAGAITNVEGEKATQAIARLDRGLPRKAYLSALDDLDAVIKRSVETAKAKAQPQATVNPAAPAPIGFRGVQKPTTVPPQAIDFLKSEPTPERMKQFDDIFGAGAAAQHLGAR